METAGDRWRNSLTSNEGLSFRSANQAPLVVDYRSGRMHHHLGHRRVKLGGQHAIGSGVLTEKFALGKEPSPLIRTASDVQADARSFPELEAVESFPCSNGLQAGMRRVDFFGLQSAIFGPVCQ